MKYLAILIFIVAFAIAKPIDRARSQFIAIEEPIHYDWIKSDSLFFIQLNDALNSNPIQVLKLFKVRSDQDYDLGFGYSYQEGSFGKGYVSTFYKVLMYKNAIESIELEQQMPQDDRLTNKYKDLLKGIYIFTGNFPIKRYIDKRTATLSYDGTQFETIDDSVKYLMTPFSGLEYGDRGGFVGSLLENRRHFLAIKYRLTYDDYRILIKSKNPTTRLTALEYFKSIGDTIMANDTTMTLLFNNPVYVKTMNGCIMDLDSAKSIFRRVHRFMWHNIKNQQPNNR